MLKMLRQRLPIIRTLVVSKIREVSLSTGSLIDLNVDQEGIAALRMQRSPVNGMNLEFLQELDKSIDIIAEKETCKGLVITSAFPTVFSAGLDLGELHKPVIKRLEAYASTIIDVFMKLYNSPFATAVAINGHAAAGACILSTTFEYRVMVNRNILMGLNDTSVGVVPSEWILKIMSEMIGKRQAEKAIIGSTMFSPDEALKVGLVDELAIDDVDAIEKCKKFIRKFDNISQSVRASTKRLMRKPLYSHVQENKQKYVKYFVLSITNPETQKNIDVYVQNMKLKKAKNVNKILNLYMHTYLLPTDRAGLSV